MSYYIDVTYDGTISVSEHYPDPDELLEEFEDAFACDVSMADLSEYSGRYSFSFADYRDTLDVEPILALLSKIAPYVLQGSIHYYSYGDCWLQSFDGKRRVWTECDGEVMIDRSTERLLTEPLRIPDEKLIAVLREGLSTCERLLSVYESLHSDLASTASDESEKDS